MPALHSTQPAPVVIPTDELKRPAAHAVQDELPLAALYFPLPHRLHDAPSKYVPGVQLLHIVAPGAEASPSVHGIHTAEELAPTTVLYVPEAQLAQAELPLPMAYLPAMQLLQAAPPEL